MTNDKFADLFGEPVRKPEQLTQFHMDMAASVQAVAEEIVLRLARAVRAETGMRNLCLAGGVALNCVANGKLLREGLFDGLLIQPAAGDAGGALGAALAGYHLFQGKRRDVPAKGDAMRGSYLGPEFRHGEVEAELKAAGARFEVLDDTALIETTAGGSPTARRSAGCRGGWSSGRAP